MIFRKWISGEAAPAAGAASPADDVASQILGKNKDTQIVGEFGAGGSNGEPLVSEGKKPFDRTISLTKEKGETKGRFNPAKFHKLFDSQVTRMDYKYQQGFLFDHPLPEDVLNRMEVWL